MCKGGGRVGSGKDDEAVQRARTPVRFMRPWVVVVATRPIFSPQPPTTPNHLQTPLHDDETQHRRALKSLLKEAHPFQFRNTRAYQPPNPPNPSPGPSIAPHHRIEHPRPARRKRHAGPQERRLRRKIRPGRRRCCSLGRDPSYRDARPSGPFIGSVPISRRPDVAA